MLAGQKQQHPALTAVEGLMLRSGKPLRSLSFHTLWRIEVQTHK